MLFELLFLLLNMANLFATISSCSLLQTPSIFTGTFFRQTVEDTELLRCQNMPGSAFQLQIPWCIPLRPYHGYLAQDALTKLVQNASSAYPTAELSLHVLPLSSRKQGQAHPIFLQLPLFCTSFNELWIKQTAWQISMWILSPLSLRLLLVMFFPVNVSAVKRFLINLRVLKRSYVNRVSWSHPTLQIISL